MRLLKLKNNDLRELLLRPLQEQFNTSMNEQGITPESQPDIYQQQLEIFQNFPSSKVYSKEYRLEIEKWANHQIQINKNDLNSITLKEKYYEIKSYVIFHLFI